MKKERYIGILGTLLVHACVVALLLLLAFTVPQPDEEAGGVAVMMADAESAHGWDDPSLVDVDVMEEEAPQAPQVPDGQELLTQTEEESVTIKPKRNPAEPSPAEKAAEAERLAKEKAERERKAAAEAIKKSTANAFSRGAKMDGNQGTANTGTGSEGSPDGNVPTGAKAGTNGQVDLRGRSLRGAGLPLPTYRVQEEGQVMVNITVNPAGEVVAASVDLQKTNTQNAALRRAAVEAARKARFDEVDGVSNQMGSITYFFKLK